MSKLHKALLRFLFFSDNIRIFESTDPIESESDIQVIIKRKYDTKIYIFQKRTFEFVSPCTARLSMDNAWLYLLDNVILIIVRYN
jgi:hypothetical protein